MKTHKLVVTRKGLSPIKTTIHAKVAELIKRYTMELPKHPSGEFTHAELLFPKQHYDKIAPELVDLLKDQEFAEDVVFLLETMDSEHLAIILEEV